MNTKSTGDPIIISIDADLEDLIPGYLQNRKADIQNIHAYLLKNEWEKIRIVGHSMKGNGGGYGFDRITELGFQLEQGAKNSDEEAVRHAVQQLEQFLDRVEVRYVEQ